MPSASLLILDQIDGASAEIGVPGLMGAVRIGTLQMTGYTSWAEALIDAMKIGGVPQPGDPHPADERCLLTRARARALGDKTIRVELIYERVPLVTYNKRTYTKTMQTMNLPRTRKQIICYLAGNTIWPGANPLIRAATIAVDIPHQQLNLSIAVFGAPLGDLVGWDVQEAVGCVNDRGWMGFPKGYWKCDGVNIRAIEPADTFEVALCFYVDVVFTTQCVHDWSQWSFLKLPNGQYLRATDSDIAAVLARGYDSNAPSTFVAGLDWPSNSGFTVSYPYVVANFYAIFGVQ